MTTTSPKANTSRSTCSSSDSTTIVNETELLDRIRSLMAYHEDDDNDGGKYSAAAAANSSSDNNDDDIESNREYQELVQQVEEKLIHFLQEHIQNEKNDDHKQQSTSARSTTTTCTAESPTSSRTVADNKKNAKKSVLPIHQAHAYPCGDTHKVLPAPPKDWPQRPIMVRPTPGSSTKIRGIRYASERDYKSFSGFCAGCILPVNAGNEAPGRSLVVDFESSHFVGTLLLRIRDIQPAVKEQQRTPTTTTTTNTNYFDRRKRRFQGIVKGKFKTALPMSECVTGQVFHRAAGKLPAQWVVSTFVKFVSTLAPQLEATIDGDNPRFLCPLVATAQTVLAKPHPKTELLLKDTTNNNNVVIGDVIDDSLFNYSVYLGSTDIEEEVHEPPAASNMSIMQDVHRDLGIKIPTTTNDNNNHNDSSSVSSRMKARKKAYNSVSAQKCKQPCFSLDHEYTFEFYQHLLIFHEPEFVLDLGRPIGKVPLSPITNGQPIKFMSAHQAPNNNNNNNDGAVLDSLWSFDIWHESMYPIAKQALHDQAQEYDG